MSAPTLGHLDPVFLQIMNETVELVRFAFETRNRLTLAVSGTGSAGMEAALVNFIEPGDRVVVALNGHFGQRMAEMASRCGADLVVVEAPWGQPVDPDDVRRALAGGRTRLLAVVHVETSTGVLQPLEDLARMAHEAGALFAVDAVTSLGACPVRVDATGVDVCFSCSQKCLACPPGLAPLTVSPAAEAVLAGRRRPVLSWYLDLSILAQYWGQERFYHHTAPIHMVYALREGLRLLQAEGLEVAWRRHRLHGQALQAGLEAMGLEVLAPEGYRAPMITAVKVPPGVDEAAVRRCLAERHNLEIGGGLGPLRGRVWRIGLMGYNCQEENVFRCLHALEDALLAVGHRVPPRAGVEAARSVYADVAVA